MKYCKVEDCGRGVCARGFCKKHYYAARRSGMGVLPKRTVSQRFWPKVERGPRWVCWEWQGSKAERDYGRFRVAGRLEPAHRVAYELVLGEIPEGLSLDHLCRNHSCVNPWHLDPVDHRENVLRGESFAAENVKKTHCPQGHPYDEVNTRWYEGRRYCRGCVRERNRQGNGRSLEVVA